jgi:hypothetical protein
MSRGPGRIQRAIEDAFRQNSSSTYTVEDLAVIAYPGVNRIEKKHRVAVLRAGAAAAEACGWWYGQAEMPGHQMLYCNPLDVRSYATWNIRRDFIEGRQTAEQIAKALDDPKVHFSRWSWVQPGGAWWQHVEINKARAAGDNTAAEQQIAALNASVNARLAQIGTPR